MSEATAAGRAGLLGHGAMLVFSVLIAGSFSLGAMTAHLMEPVAFQAVRFTCAALVVGAVGLMTGAIKGADLRAPWRWLVLGATFSTYFVLMFEGLKTAPPVTTAAVMTLVPVMTAGFSWVFLRQVTTARIAVALGLGALGALWVIFRGDFGRLVALEVGRGEIVYFVGCVAHAVYVPMVRKLGRGESALSASFWVLVAGAAVLIVLGWSDLRATDFKAMPQIYWVALAYLSIGAMAMTFTLLNFASVRLKGAKVMAYTYLVPGWVILWELALGHGVPEDRVLLGFGVTALAMVLLLKDEAR